MSYSVQVKEFIEQIEISNPNEKEFIQAVKEVVETIVPFINEPRNAEFQDKKLLERMVEPERIIIFRVTWVDDKGEIQINKGYRVQMNSAIGPYKGGLRFHPSVNLSILKFLAFEQIFKNSLTSLPLGGGKGGSDFDPKGKSDGEIMRFCQSFMTGLAKHIGSNTDVPAGDIGVGAREIGYMYGQYKRLQNEFTGVLTGKGITYGGSLIRPEATGYGVVYFCKNMLHQKGLEINCKNILISGSGNVAQFAAEKSLEMGGKVLTMSDSSGYIYDEEGIDQEKLAFIKNLKNVKRERISAYINKYPKAKFVAKKRPWDVKGDIALPCATQNEIDHKDAENLVANGCICVTEGSNMSATAEAIKVFRSARILFSPGKASNAGGVAVSGLEMAQNSLRMSWTSEEVDEKLVGIMENIHQVCMQYGQESDGFIDYVKGANIAGFVKVAKAMLAQGVI